MGTKKEMSDRARDASDRTLAMGRLRESAESLERACGARFLTLCVVPYETGHGQEERVIAQWFENGVLKAQSSWAVDADTLGAKVVDVLQHGMRLR